MFCVPVVSEWSAKDDEHCIVSLVNLCGLLVTGIRTDLYKI